MVSFLSSVITVTSVLVASQHGMKTLPIAIYHLSDVLSQRWRPQVLCSSPDSLMVLILVTFQISVFEANAAPFYLTFRYTLLPLKQLNITHCD